MNKSEQCIGRVICHLAYLGIAVLGLCPVIGRAQSPATITNDEMWGSPEYKQLIEEVVYPIKVRRPISEKFFPLVVSTRKSSSTQECDSSKPEDVVRDWLVRMSVPSYVLALKCWDVDAQAKFQKMDKEEGKSVSTWHSEWSRIYSGNNAALTARIDFGQYVLIEYKVVKSASNQVVTYETVALREFGGRWLLTLAAVETPVPLGWGGKNLRTQRVFNTNSQIK